MRKFLISVLLVCGILFSLEAIAIEERKSVAVFSLDVPVNSSSYAIYSNTQNMFAADLVNSLQSYNDMAVVDIYSSKRVIKSASLDKKYEKMVKEYKQKYVIDYEKMDEIAAALGVDYVALVYGGFDMEKSFLKSNWKYRWQWIWANPVKSSAQLNINTTLVDVKKRTYILEGNLKKDIDMDNFQEPAQSFGENIVPISEIKKFTSDKAPKLAKKIHDAIYPNKKEKVSKKDAFIERFTPNDTFSEYGVEQVPANDLIDAQSENSSAEASTTSVEEKRKFNYKKWLQERL